MLLGEIFKAKVVNTALRLILVSNATVLFIDVDKLLKRTSSFVTKNKV